MLTIIIERVQFPNYNFFYSLAFLISVVVLVRLGWVKKFPVIPWLLVVTTGFLFFVIGSKAIVFTADDWRNVSLLHPVEHATGAAVMGGVVLSFCALLVARKVLGFQSSMLDTFAWVIPAGMAIQRFGCLLAGCCFGVPTHLPWAVQYGPSTSVFHFHAHQHLIGPDALLSAGIHPIQLYESLGCVLIVLLLLRLRNQFKAGGNLLLFSGLCYYALRFGLGFLRADETNTLGGFYWGGLPVIQWVFLTLTVGSAIVIFCRERWQPLQPKEGQRIQPKFTAVLYFFFLSIVFALSSVWLNSIEILAVYLAFIPISVLIFIKLFESFTTPAFRLGTLVLLCCAFLMMSQIAPESAEPTGNASGNPIVKTFYEISGGYTFGDTDITTQTGSYYSGGGGCDGGGGTTIPLYTSFDINNKSGTAGFSRSWVRQNGNQLKFGINGTGGSLQEKIYSDNLFESTNKVNFWSVNPYLKWDGMNIGITGGFHAGDIYRVKTDIDEDNITSGSGRPTILDNTSIYPQIGLRIGKLSSFFIETGYNDHPTTPFPVNTFRLGAGYGFRSKSGSYLTMGMGTFSAVYFSSRIVIDDRFTIEPFLGFGNGAFNSYDESSTTQGSISLSVKLGKKEIATMP